MTRQNTFVVITIYSNKSPNFWPQSRQHKPKQFLDLLGTGKSLVQLTYERSRGICPDENIYFLVPREHEQLLRDQIPHINDHQVLKEPVRRNSAPSLAYASYKIKQRYPDAVLVVTPADHGIFGDIAYVRDVRKAVEFASNNRENLITLGIKPHCPETSYGYIQYLNEGSSEFKKVKTFTKRPQEDLAKLFLESGDFAWNTKISVWHVDAITQALQKYTPDVHETFWDGKAHYFTEGEEAFVVQAFTHCKNVSITNNIIEKADNMLMLLGEFGWTDLNSWDLLYDSKEKQEHDNVIEGPHVYVQDTQNCFIKGPQEKLIVVRGLQDYLVIDTEDALLIYPRLHEENIRSLTSTIKEKKKDKYL